ncbi:MAG: hypothetical protein MK085_11570 [Phycisphaerales bacterium]|nr:hypothetical protein [Phycisphaerales bacterium]
MDSMFAFMAGIVDYAGLFPPANLDMSPTVRNYSAYREGVHAEILGRLVIPVGRFGEFEEAAAELLPRVPLSEGSEPDPDPWMISALVSPASDMDAVERDLETIDAFNDRHASEGEGAAFVDTIELKADGGGQIDAVLDLLEDEIYPYFELDPAIDLRGAFAAIAGLDAGAKIRTGGITADAHPSPRSLADFIAGCHAADVPFKATAGLHHPVRHHAESVGTKQFGFLNVFVGACLLQAEAINRDQLLEVLEEEDPSAFTASETFAGWRAHKISVEAIEAARSRFAHAFGSCSFTEPIEDLQALGLLAKETTA